MQKLFISSLLVALLGGSNIAASAPASAPQVLIAITNSQSMDGDINGAIRGGSGILPAPDNSLYNSSSPQNYTIPPSYIPPIDQGNGTIAPYTVASPVPGCAVGLCDNSASRLNVSKEFIQNSINNFNSVINFGLYDYSTSGVNVYTTWVYYMSNPGGFTFTNTLGANTVANPCYNYTTASVTVKANCSAMAGRYAGLATFAYMTIAASSDDPAINDVLYASGLTDVFVNFTGPTPASPFPPTRTLANYNAGTIILSYSNSSPSGFALATGPTNAGYVPFSQEVMYAKRGFGFYGNQSATTGNLVVPMNSSPASFNAALAPEKSLNGTSEIKASAVQAPTAGLMNGARAYLTGLPVTCRQQYIILLTDGLPTQSLNGKLWPPLGTTSGTNYGLTATFDATTGALTVTNDEALTDAIAAIQASNTAGIKTYVIGLGAGVNNAANPLADQTLRAMAVAGNTNNYYPANSEDALAQAFAAILNQIYSESSISAPVPPLKTGGSSFIYDLRTDPAPTAGHVRAYAIAANGNPAGSPTWDAGTLMTKVGRQAALLSTAADNTTIIPFTSLDNPAFNLVVPTACVPDQATIINYTIDPSFAYTPPSATIPCKYLGIRQPNWFLGGFSLNNVGEFMGLPSSGSLVSVPGYVAYVSSLSSRPAALLFTSNDGFLYAVNATTGNLLWAWTPRNLVSRLQNFNSFPANRYFNGNFKVVDAQDGGGSWGSYIVGSLQSGSEHFILKLNSSGVPTSVIYDGIIPGATSPGDVTAQIPGNAPAHQPTQIVRVAQPYGYATYIVYVANTTIAGVTTSRLYEQNVATGAITTGILPFVLTSALQYDQPSNQLFAGDGSGRVWGLVTSGSATTDVTNATILATTRNPANGGAATPVLYVGYAEVKDQAYLWAFNPSEVTVFTNITGAWLPVFASTNLQGYTYSSGSFAVDGTVNKLDPSGIVSDTPQLINGALFVPTYVAISCGPGSAYADFFNVTNGKIPTNIFLNGTAITSNLYVGTGLSFAASSIINSGGVSVYTGAENNAQQYDANGNPLPSQPNKPLTSKSTDNTAVHWRQR